MSESSVPFQGPSAAQAGPIIEPEAQGGKNRLLLLGVGAAVIVVALLVYFLVFAGGGGTDTTSATPPAKHVEAAAPAAPAAQPPVQRINAKSFGRDPFKALIAPADPVGAVGGTGTTTVAPAPTTGGTTTGGTTTGGTTIVGGTGSVSTGGTPVVPVVTADHTFRVVGVSSDQTRITVRVDGKSYSGLKAGDVFATYFKVVVIGGKVNGFQFGDEKFSVLGTKQLSIAA